MSSVNQEWIEWVITRPLEHRPRHIASVQRMYQDLTFTYPPKGEDAPSTLWDFELSESGYTPVKLTQLKTYYMPEENLDRALGMIRQRVDKNKYGSVLIPHQGRLKRGFTQNDYCMIGTTLTYYPKEQGIYWCTHWRSTEAIKRARGDFLLIQYMIDRLGIGDDLPPVLGYTFKFDTLTFHPMMLPLSFPFIHWRAYLKDVRNHDAVLHRDIVRWMVYYFHNPEETYRRYSSAHQVQKIVTSQLSPKELSRVTRYAQKHYDGGRRG